MPREHLATDEFLVQLASLIRTTQQNGHGSVWLTQKPCLLLSSAASPSDRPRGQKVADGPPRDLHPPKPLPIIVRATDGKTKSADRVKNKDVVKLSTIVQPDDLDAFFTRYAEVCKTGMQSLKKRDRKKAKSKKKGRKAGTGTGTGVEEKK